MEHRRALEQQLRGAVLGSGDGRLLRRWVDADWGADDVSAWRHLARNLPGGSPQRAAAAARAHALDAAPTVPPQAGRHAAWLQRSGSWRAEHRHDRRHVIGKGTVMKYAPPGRPGSVVDLALDAAHFGPRFVTRAKAPRCHTS